MDTLRHMRYSAVVALAAFVLGCDGDNGVAPPPPPPQISLENFNAGNNGKPGMDHRLPDNQVYDVFVDSQDRIWFSTDQGVAMKDGSQAIVSFDDFDGIPNRFCRGITELNGNLYVGTWGGGVAKYDGATWSALPVREGNQPGVVAARVSDIASDGTSLWIGTVRGVSEYIDDDGLPEAQRWIDHTSTMGSSRVVSSVLFIDHPSRGEEVWVGTKDGGITVIRPTGSQRFTAATTALPADDITGLAYSGANDLVWVAMAANGIASVDVAASKWTTVTSVNGLGSDLATGVTIRDRNGEEIWVATQTGMSVMKNSRFTNYIKGSGIPSERLRTVTADNRGAVWGCFIEAGAGRVVSYEIR